MPQGIPGQDDNPEPAAFSTGFYSINHTDCLESLTHHCFDGTTGELAHAFFPPHGEIHFDDHEYWILGNTRFSWKKGSTWNSWDLDFSLGFV